MRGAPRKGAQAPAAPRFLRRRCICRRRVVSLHCGHGGTSAEGRTDFRRIACADGASGERLCRFDRRKADCMQAQADPTVCGKGEKDEESEDHGAQETFRRGACRTVRRQGTGRMPDAERGTGVLCRLREARRTLRRGVEGGLPIRFRTLARSRKGRRTVLLRRLDQDAGSCDMQLQRRTPPRHFQVGSDGRGVGDRLRSRDGMKRANERNRMFKSQLCTVKPVICI